MHNQTNNAGKMPHIAEKLTRGVLPWVFLLLY